MRTLIIRYGIQLPGYRSESRFIEVLIHHDVLNRLIIDGQATIVNGEAVMIILGPAQG